MSAAIAGGIIANRLAIERERREKKERQAQQFINRDNSKTIIEYYPKTYDIQKIKEGKSSWKIEVDYVIPEYKDIPITHLTLVRLTDFLTGDAIRFENIKLIDNKMEGTNGLITLVLKGCLQALENTEVKDIMGRKTFKINKDILPNENIVLNDDILAKEILDKLQTSYKEMKLESNLNNKPIFNAGYRNTGY